MEYPKVGSTEYIINEKLSFENGQIVSAELAALRAENERLNQLWKRDSEHLLEVGAENAKLREHLKKTQHGFS